jgi:hypothetical protein
MTALTDMRHRALASPDRAAAHSVADDLGSHRHKRWL